MEAKNTPTVASPSALKRKADGGVSNTNDKQAKGGFVIVGNAPKGLQKQAGF